MFRHFTATRSTGKFNSTQAQTYSQKMAQARMTSEDGFTETKSQKNEERKMKNEIPFRVALVVEWWSRVV